MACRLATVPGRLRLKRGSLELSMSIRWTYRCGSHLRCIQGGGAATLSHALLLCGRCMCCMQHCVVDEAGASVYSVTAEAQAELAGLPPGIVSAVSLARRLQVRGASRVGHHVHRGRVSRLCNRGHPAHRIVPCLPAGSTRGACENPSSLARGGHVPARCAACRAGHCCESWSVATSSGMLAATDPGSTDTHAPVT